MIVLGLIGFAAGSKISLAAAGAIGFLMIASVALHKSNPRAARIMAAVVSLVAILAEFRNFSKHWAIWPHGIALFFSLGIFAALGMGHMLAQKKGL